jgi:uncharacterized cupin superfamily protein
MNLGKNNLRWQITIPVVLLALSIVVVSARVDSVSRAIAIVDFPAAVPADMKLYPVESNNEWQIEGDSPVAGARLDYSSDDDQFHVDYSYYSKQTATFKNYPIGEFIYIIEGQVEMIDTNNNSKIYGPGDMFLIPKGFQGTWRQLALIKKIAVIHGDYISATE